MYLKILNIKLISGKVIMEIKDNLKKEKFIFVPIVQPFTKFYIKLKILFYNIIFKINLYM